MQEAQAVTRETMQPGYNNLPPYPNGWYAACSSAQLKKGQIISKKFCGHDIVLFRTKNGVAAAVDAYCPHMGAHFAHGGTVEGETIKCPFHDFCFDVKGTCTSTGYGTKPPPKAVLRSWHLQEKNGFVLVWFHSQEKAPHWEVPAIDFEGWTPVITREWELKVIRRKQRRTVLT